MKFLDVARLNAVTSYLENCVVGDRRLRGRVEAYSCKAAGEDKKLHKLLQQQYGGVEGAALGGEQAASPAEAELSDGNSRRLFFNLICTMNATFPDYDFSGLKPDQFARQNLGVVVNTVNTILSEIVEKHNGHFLEELWGAIDQEVDLRQAEVLTYLPDVSEDPFNVPGSLWSFNYFFHNPQERKMLFFTCCCTTSTGGQDFYGNAREEDEEAFNDMASETMSNADEADDLLDAGLEAMQGGEDSDDDSDEPYGA